MLALFQNELIDSEETSNVDLRVTSLHRRFQNNFNTIDGSKSVWSLRLFGWFGKIRGSSSFEKKLRRSVGFCVCHEAGFLDVTKYVGAHHGCERYIGPIGSSAKGT